MGCQKVSVNQFLLSTIKNNKPKVLTATSQYAILYSFTLPFWKHKPKPTQQRRTTQ